MKAITLLTVISAGLLASASQAMQTASAEHATHDASSTDVPEKKICKRIVPTGSMLAERFCLTKTEWRQFDNINGDNVDGMFRRRAGAICRGSGGAFCSQ